MFLKNEQKNPGVIAEIISAVLMLSILSKSAQKESVVSVPRPALTNVKMERSTNVQKKGKKEEKPYLLAEAEAVPAQDPGATSRLLHFILHSNKFPLIHRSLTSKICNITISGWY